MKRLSVVLVVLFGMAMMQTSCGKYEEGPALSLRTKTARLTGEWQLTGVTYNGIVMNLSQLEIGDYTREYEKDGTFGLSYVMYSELETAKGEWQFDDSKEHLEYRIQYGNDWSEWEKEEILRLTNDELWLSDTYVDDGQTNVTVTKFTKK